jgi:UDPglucose 6-dehydrogenase
MTTHSSPTAFVGLSHLGIVSSIAWASFGRSVVGYDADADRVNALEEGTFPIHEPGLPELFAKTRPALRFSSELEALSGCPLVIVSLDVPTGADDTSDLAPIVLLVERIVPVLQDGVVLVVMSQVPPGFTRSLAARIKTLRPALSFTLYYWVETLIFGRAVERALKPERIIVGCADPRQPLREVFERGLEAFKCPILPMRYESAELTKTAINLYLVGSVTYANTLADLCEALQADWEEMVPALRMDQRIGPAAYLRPSLGIAGGNLERDLHTLKGLCDRDGVDSGYLASLIQYNVHRYHWVLRMLREHVFHAESFPRLAIWGLTYKKNTRSMKNSPALRLISDLGRAADVRAWDPVISATEVDLPVRVLSSRDSVLDGADGLLILSDWDEFAACDLGPIRTSMRHPVVIDCVGALELRRAELAGIRYVSMGRAVQGNQ